MRIHKRKLLLFLVAVSSGGAAAAACGSDNSVGPRDGSIRVETTSSGEDLDQDGYTVTVDRGATDAIGLFDHVIVNGLDLGGHLVTLGGMAENCASTSANPQSIDVVGGDTVTVGFEVACEPVAPPGGGDGGDNVIGTQAVNMMVIEGSRATR
jgi:hypothetical protein